jgi:hypothetical protein
MTQHKAWVFRLEDLLDTCCKIDCYEQQVLVVKLIVMSSKNIHMKFPVTLCPQNKERTLIY